MFPKAIAVCIQYCIGYSTHDYVESINTEDQLTTTSRYDSCFRMELGCKSTPTCICFVDVCAKN